MAKRRAEPLVCHVPFKRPPREPPPPRPAAPPERRPRGEAAAAAAQDDRAEKGGGRGAGRAAEQEEDFCQYNSFLYWRAPLPTIDMSDIQNLDGETPPEAKTPSRTDTMDTEMET